MILVTGATGNVGSKVLAALKATDEELRALVRSQEQGAAIGVPYAVGDFGDVDSLDRALEGVSTAFLLCAPGPDQDELELAFVAACARAAGAVHLVKLSAVGAEVEPLPDVPFLRWHAAVEAALRASELSWTLLRPHSYMSNLLAHGGSVRAQRAMYAPLGAGRVPWVDPRDVAELAAGVLRDPADHRGEVYAITGPEALDMGEVAERVSAVVGERVSYVDVPSEAAREGLLEAGMPAWQADAVVALDAWYREGDVSVVSPAVPILLARPARTIDAFLAEHRAVFA